MRRPLPSVLVKSAKILPPGFGPCFF